MKLHLGAIFFAGILFLASVTHANSSTECESGIATQSLLCNENADCVSVSYGCYGVCSVNKKFEEEARAKLHALGGDPAVLDCVQLDEDGTSLHSNPGMPVCDEGVCQFGKELLGVK